MSFYRLVEYEKAFAEALKFNYPTLHWDPLMRAAALGQMGRVKEAGAALVELLQMVPDFAHNGQQLIKHFVKVDELAHKIAQGLRRAGLQDFQRGN